VLDNKHLLCYNKYIIRKENKTMTTGLLFIIIAFLLLAGIGTLIINNDATFYFLVIFASAMMLFSTFLVVWG
jgi:hypothetical protein